MLSAALAALPLLTTSPAFAQAAIQEPGLYSFYHPDGDLLGVGARQIRPGAGVLGASPSTVFAAVPPRATLARKRAPRTVN